MWHEVRRQEKKLRGILVDYRRRAERKKNYFNRIRSDPTQFMQLHGRKCRIFLDLAIAAAAEGPTSMMPWQGDVNNMIDRFDVRAHLDYIPSMKTSRTESSNVAGSNESENEKRQICYERYRVVAQNNYLGISEEKFLKQLYHEEQFGNLDKDFDKKRGRGSNGIGGTAIGFNYDDTKAAVSDHYTFNYSDDSEDDLNHNSREIDFDLTIDASKLDTTQASELNKSGCIFGMQSNDFYSFLINDIEEAENEKLAQEIQEQVKSLGRTRRERRLIRERRLARKPYSPPSYAAKDSPKYNMDTSVLKRSNSRSSSDDKLGPITYITSFGDDDEMSSLNVSLQISGSCRAYNKRKESIRKTLTSTSPIKYSSRPGVFVRKKNRSHIRIYRKSKSRSRNRSHSRGRIQVNSRSKGRSRSQSPVYMKNHRQRSRSHSHTRKRKRSESRHNDLEKLKKSHNKRRIGLDSPLEKQSKKIKSYKNENHINELEDLKKIQGSPPLRRYYGRGRDQSSSSELSISNGVDNHSDDCSNVKETLCTEKHTTNHNTSRSIKVPNSLNMSSETPQYKLKLKMKELLNRQFQADKDAEKIRNKKTLEEQQSRKDERREQSSKFRERRKRLRRTSTEFSTSNTDSRSRSLSTSSSNGHSIRMKYRRSRTKSRSRNCSRSHRSSRNRSNSRCKNRSRHSDRSRNRNRSQSRSKDIETFKKFLKKSSSSNSLSSSPSKSDDICKRKSLVDY